MSRRRGDQERERSGAGENRSGGCQEIRRAGGQESTLLSTGGGGGGGEQRTSPRCIVPYSIMLRNHTVPLQILTLTQWQIMENGASQLESELRRVGRGGAKSMTEVCRAP